MSTSTVADNDDDVDDRYGNDDNDSDDNGETKAAIEVHGAGSDRAYWRTRAVSRSFYPRSYAMKHHACVSLLSEETTFLALPCYKIRF